MWSLKRDTNEPTYKRETELQTQEQTCGPKRAGGGGREGLGVWDQQMQTTVYGKDKQQVPTV